MGRLFVLLALFALAAAACNGDEKGGAAAGPLEIGTRQPPCSPWGESCAGAFAPLADGDPASVVLDPHGSLDMLLLSLRAAEADPHAPRATVTVTVAEQVIGANVPGERADMQSDGVGFVLWDLRVPFQQELCCYACRDARVDGRLEDASGRVFTLEVTVLLRRSGRCPDPEACCASAEACPEPSMTQLCGEL